MLLPRLGLTCGHQNAHKIAHGRHSGGPDSKGSIIWCTTQIYQLPGGSSGSAFIGGPTCPSTLLLVTALSGASESTAAESRAIDRASASAIVSAGSARATGSASARAGPACGGQGFRSWKGRGFSAVDSSPPGAVPKYPDPGQHGNDLSRSRRDRIRSGAGLFPSGFPNPPTTCLNFSLWRDLSVWRIWGGSFGRRRSGWGGVFWRRRRRPRRRLI